MNVWGSDENGAKSPAINHSNSVPPRVDVIKNLGNSGDNYLVAVGSRASRFRRKQQNKIILAFLIGLIVFLLVVLIVLSVYYDKEKRHKICETPECVRSAANLLMSMDESVDPCDNFYQYACGKWGEEHPKPDFVSSYDWFSDKKRKVDLQIRDILSSNLTDKNPSPLVHAKNVFKACNNTEKLDELGVQPIVDFLRSVEVPVLPSFLNLTNVSEASKDPFDWLRSIILIKKRIDLDVLIGFDIFPGPKNVTLKKLVLGEPTSSNPLPVYSENDKILQKIKDEIFRKPSSTYFLDDLSKDDEEHPKKESVYRKNVKKVMTQTVKELYKSLDKNRVIEVTDDKLEENVGKAVDQYVNFSKEVYELYEELANETANEPDFDSDDEGIIEITVDKLQDDTDTILKIQNLSTVEVYKPYLLGLFNGTGITLNFNNDTILTSEPDLKFLFAVMTMIQTTPPSVIELFVWCHVVENLIPHSSTTIRDLYDKCVRSLTGAESSPPRSIRCASSVGSMMGMAVGYAVVDPSFLNTTLPKVEKMLENIRSGFENLILSLGWMDLATKAATIEKVRNMRSLIGFPKWLLNVTKLEQYYEGVVSDPEKHLENFIGLVELSFRNHLKAFRRPYSFNWETEPTEVNAYHTFQANAITIPMVMLQYPFYDLGLESLNYGAIGTILGHELTHGFDNLGRQYDKDGVYVQWWTNSTIESFKDNARCFVDQYSDFYVPEVDKYVDGNLTLGENIADNGGVRSAMIGYWKEKENPISLPGLSHLNNNQLFFLSYANLWCGVNTVKSLSYDLRDEHSPNHLRLRGVLQNIPEFAKEFKCKRNTTMNPSKQRCIMF